MAGLLFEVFGGLITWTFFRGVQGILLASTVGGLSPLLIRRLRRWPASSSAGAVGALVGSFFAISCMEVYPPGSIEWALKGGFHGAMWGLPVAMLLGLLGLLRHRSEPI